MKSGQPMPEAVKRQRSHPTRGAWIEIDTVKVYMTPAQSRTPHGVRGLKCLGHHIAGHGVRVAPHTGCVD